MAPVTIATIENHLGRGLNSVERTRVELDISAVYEILENYLRRKLADTTITDERHVGVSEIEEFRFDWRPVKEMIGVRWGGVSNPLETVYNAYYHEQLVPRDQVYFISYVAAGLTGYTSTIERVVVSAVMHPLLLPDIVRYRGLSSYSVEGTSITYNTTDADKTGVGPISGTDLTGLVGARRRLIV